MTKSGIFYVTLLIALIGGRTGPVFGQEMLNVSVGESPFLQVEAGGVGSRLVLISNPGVAQQSSRLTVTLPHGWSLLIPPPLFTVAASGAVRQLVSFQIPVSTPAGMYVVRLAAENSSGEEAELTVEVRPRFSTEIEWIEKLEFVRAGSQIPGSLSLFNSGNAPVTLKLSAESSLDYLVNITPQTVDLGAGETAEVTVRVTTREDIVSQQSHSLVVQISRTGAEREAPLRSAFITTILPVQQASNQNKEGMLPVRLSFSATTEEGRQAGQVEVELPETSIGSRKYEALVRAPDVRNASVFAQSDQFSFKMSTPHTTVRLGDQVYGLTDLLENGALGFGADLVYNRPVFSVGGFAQRSRKIFPEREQAGAFVHLRPFTTLKLEANVIAKRTYESGEAVSFAAEYSPGESLIRAEYAMGWFDREAFSERVMGRAVSLSGNTGYKSSTLSLDFESADSGFLGSIQNMTGGSGSFSLVLRPWVRINAQANARRRFYDLLGGAQESQTSASARTGITFTRTGNARSFITISGIKQINENTLSALTREDVSAELRAGTNRRRLGIGTTLTAGQASDGLNPNLDPYFSATGNVFGNKGRFSMSFFGSYLQGPTFYNPVAQQRIMIGSSLGWDSGSGTRANVNVFKSIDLEVEQQEFLLSDARLSHQFSFGHEVLLRARLAQTSSDSSIRNGTFGVTYRIPLLVPAPGTKKDVDEVRGRVMDAESGLPVPNIRLTLDARTAITDSKGNFALRVPQGFTGYLSIDRLSMGLDRRPIQEFPLAITPQDAQRQPLDIQIVRSSRIHVHLALDSLSSAGRLSALAGGEGNEIIAGVVVEARSGQYRVRKISSRTGLVELTDLVPGNWDLFVVGRTLRNGYQSQPDTMRVNLGFGETQSVSLAIKPIRRDVQIVSSGTAVIGKGIRPVHSGAVRVTPPGTDPDPIPDPAPMPVPAPVPDPTREEALASETNPTPKIPTPTVPTTHVVARGETLSSLARLYYNSTGHWVRIWLVNRDVIASPDVVQPGTELRIPARGPLSRVENNSLLEYAKRTDF